VGAIFLSLKDLDQHCPTAELGRRGRAGVKIEQHPCTVHTFADLG